MHFTPLRSALVYALLGTVWFVVSHRLIDWIHFTEPGSLATHVARGLVFIAATTVLIYWLSHRSRASALHEATMARVRADLREARTFQSALVDVSPLPLMTIDPDGRGLTWNESAERVFGWTEDEVVGQPMPIVPEEKLAEFTALRERVLGGESLSNVEVERQRKDGTSISLRLSTAPIRDAEGEVVAIMAALEDITESKRIQAALSRSQERRTHIEHLAGFGTWEWDIASDAVAWSKGLCEIFGLDPAQPPPPFTQSSHLYHPEDFVQLSAAVQSAVDAAQPYELELRVLRPDGELRTCIVRAEPETDANGKVVRLYGFCHDVSDRKRQELERERLHRAVEQAGEAILITDVAGAIEYVNPAFERISGFCRRDVLGNNPSLQKSGEHDEAFYRQMWETIVEGRTWHGRIINHHKDGSPYTADASISPVRDPAGAIVNFVAVLRDVSRELDLENQLLQARKMESIGSLAGGIAHDFNNMLTVILGNLELALAATPADDPRIEELTEARDAGGRSAELVGQLLGFARKQIIAPRTLDLNAAVDARLGMLGRLLGEDLDLCWKPARKPWPIHVDPSQLDQILTNLLVNARDAIGGVGRITIETRNVSLDDAYCADHLGSQPGDYLMLVVSDSGCGMDGEILDRVFEPFFTTKAAGQGTGLGLSTVYGIVKQNNGYVNAYSEPGQGSTFRIYLPRHSKAGDPDCAAKPPQTERRGSETVLVVEDEAPILKLATRQLEKLGYSVLAATAADTAIQLARAHQGPIHLLLTDVVMPNMNGRELYGRLLSARPDLKCLYMSGYTAQAIAHRGVLEPGVHFLHKPFAVGDMSAALREVLEA